MTSKIFCALVLSAVVATEAFALCYTIGPGLFVVNHRTGVLRGGNFRASVKCTRNSPKFMIWSGGTMCEGGSFYGRYLGRPFSCSVRKITR
jgi:hypothetical protein